MKKWIDYASVLLLGSVLLYWLTFVDKIGVHGDEAWGGLNGIKIIERGISRPYGIVPYTGLLQSLVNAAMFECLGIDIVPMRITGILCNLLGICALIYLLRKRFTSRVALFFLLFFAQSAFYLLYAKISWEVCSFNLLFTSLCLVSIDRVHTYAGRRRIVWSFVFLSVSLLGGYNHIIFSGLPVAALVGIVAWTLFGQCVPSRSAAACTTLLFLAVLNSGLLYWVLRDHFFAVWSALGLMFFLLPFIGIALECFLVEKMTTVCHRLLSWLAGISVHGAAKIAFVAVCLFAFAVFHGSLLLKVFSQQIVLFHIFSYQLAFVANIFFLIAGALIVSLACYLLVRDLLSKNSLWAYILIVYLALLSAYTIIPSMRYLLIAGVLVFLYVGIQLISERPGVQYIVAGLLIVNMALIQTTLWQINFMTDRKVKPAYFILHNEYADNSAHFLDFSPVLKSIHEEKAGIIRTRDHFFIGKVFDFYRHVDPSIQNYRNIMHVDYDYKIKGSGFEITTLSKQRD